MWELSKHITQTLEMCTFIKYLSKHQKSIYYTILNSIWRCSTQFCFILIFNYHTYFLRDFRLLNSIKTLTCIIIHDYQVWDVEHTYIVVFDLFLIHVICVVISKSEELKNIFDIGVWIVDVVLQRSFVSNIINWVVSFLFLLTHLWMHKNYNSNLHFSYNSMI